MNTEAINDPRDRAHRDVRVARFEKLILLHRHPAALLARGFLRQSILFTQPTEILTERCA